MGPQKLLVSIQKHLKPADHARRFISNMEHTQLKSPTTFCFGKNFKKKKNLMLQPYFYTLLLKELA